MDDEIGRRPGRARRAGQEQHPLHLAIGVARQNMQRSEKRILTTHVGSLPRNAVLTDLLIRDEAGEAVDKAELARQSEAAVRHVVAQQAAAGVDIVNDGEQPRVGFQTYVAQRMKGFGGESKRPRSPDYTRFPVWAEQLAR